MHNQQNTKKSTDTLPYGLHVIRRHNKLHNVTTRMEEQTAPAVCSQCTHS